MGHAHTRELPGTCGLQPAAEHAGHGIPRNSEHPEQLQREGHGRGQRGLLPCPHRGYQGGLHRPRPVSFRSCLRFHSSGRAAFGRARQGAGCAHRHEKGGRPRSSPRSQGRHRLARRGGQGRQRRLSHPEHLSRLRFRHRGRRHRRAPAEPRQLLFS